jgi:phosphatidylserine decarboxylase
MIESSGAAVLFGQVFRGLSYVSGSFLWWGAMQGLFLRRVSVSFWGGLLGVLVCWGTARVLDPLAFHRGFGGMGVHVAAVMFFILIQVFLWRTVYFFNDPDRSCPTGSLVVAPADGTIVYIRRVKEGEVPLVTKKGRSAHLEEIMALPPETPMGDGILVGIFMSPLSVHINRAPVTGKITGRWYRKGPHLWSMMPMSLRVLFGRAPYEKGSPHVLDNERETLRIEGEIPVYVTRIADRYVRRIVTWKETGDVVNCGERIGLIRMGSQTDVMFPAHTHQKSLRLTVKEGDYVYAGVTPLARWD